MELLLVPSKTHNDLLLQCLSPHQALGIPAEATITSPECADAKQVYMTGLMLELPLHKEEPQAPMWDTPSTDGASESGLSCTSTGSGWLEQELALLRLENAKLRCENNLLEHLAVSTETVARIEVFHNGVEQQWPSPEAVELFDDPFEPPPQSCHWNRSPVCSTPGSFSFQSGTLTPFSESCMSHASSGYTTPVPTTPGQITLVPVAMPVWFQTIPTGVVQQARAMFERHAVIPSFFAQG
jgi:hypothetical protein